VGPTTREAQWEKDLAWVVARLSVIILELSQENGKEREREFKFPEGTVVVKEAKRKQGMREGLEVPAKTQWTFSLLSFRRVLIAQRPLCSQSPWMALSLRTTLHPAG
jgi:hypothetical protein